MNLLVVAILTQPSRLNHKIRINFLHIRDMNYRIFTTMIMTTFGGVIHD